ncbi:hypothetical protein TNCV_950911 [Trichonephila clavipes]|nr:hypothetical protein TNCV_950911 [Trichonephila clavipes]
MYGARKKINKQKEQYVNGTENILLNGCTTTSAQNYGQKLSGRSDIDAVWNSLRYGRFMTSHVYHLGNRKVFKRFFQIEELASRAPNFYVNIEEVMYCRTYSTTSQ